MIPGFLTAFSGTLEITGHTHCSPSSVTITHIQGKSPVWFWFSSKAFVGWE